MDLVFCGTPEFAVPALAALLESGDFRVRLVVCQPDRPAGRGLGLTPPPVKRFALEHDLPVVQPEKIRDNQEFRRQLETIRPAAVVVVAYGRLIPPWMLELPPLGNINVHASLLPKYRGAAPIQWAIAHGETLTGVTTIRLDEGLDTGAILLARELAITPEDNAETLASRLADLGALLLVDTLRGLSAGTIVPRSQNSAAATLAPLLKKEDGLIDFRRTALEVWNRLRGFSPWPGAYTRFRGKTLHVWRASPLASSPQALQPGEWRLAGEHLHAGCGQGTVLDILEVQPEGKRRMSARDFANGYRPQKEDFVMGNL
jgi:methionyl-tRNA formyltransferase